MEELKPTDLYDIARECLENAKLASANTDRAIAQTQTVITIAQQAIEQSMRWQERALKAESELASRR